jgi:hypothetical protein
MIAILTNAGFEISGRFPLSELSRERLGVLNPRAGRAERVPEREPRGWGPAALTGVEAALLDVLHLNHSLLLLQCLFADGDSVTRDTADETRCLAEMKDRLKQIDARGGEWSSDERNY